MVGSFCLVRTILKPLISDGDCIWVWIFGEGGHRHRDFFSLLIHKSYFIPYVVNYEVGITLTYVQWLYVLLFLRYPVFRALCGPNTKKSKCQRHKKVKLPSNPGITHSKSKKETLATTVVACVCRDFEILQEYCFAASPQKSKSCRP